MIKKENSMINNKNVKIWTDGSCDNNPGAGGWGALICFGSTEKELFDGQKNTTNNQMEMLAVINALNSLESPCNLALYTDSQYVMNGITTWIHNWKNNGWRTSKKKSVKNKDLWIALDEAISHHEIEWHWVKGHVGNVNNERADMLARKGMELYR
jgi:ribonuclease HI